MARSLAALPSIPGAAVLVLGYGSGRNVPVFLERGARVTIVERDAKRATRAAERFAHDARVELRDDAAGPYAGVLATHALLHGTPATIARDLATMHAALVPGGALYCTLGSKSDPRFGCGRVVEEDAFAPLEGSEAGIPHAFFDERGARVLLEAFAIDELTETGASHAAGAWAHTEREAASLRHWFVRARRA